jgi:hypothetical protein
MESCAFHVPTVTTSLSGFGMWCRQQGKDQDLLDGVSVVERNDGNYLEVVAHAAEQVERLLLMPPAEMKLVRHEAHKAVSRADWAHFIRYYYQAYESAIRVMQQRVKAGAR